MSVQAESFLPLTSAVCALRKWLIDKPSSWQITWNMACNTQSLNLISVWKCLIMFSVALDPYAWIFSDWRLSVGLGDSISNKILSMMLTDAPVINNELHGCVEEWYSNFGSAWGNVPRHATDTFSIAWLIWLTVSILIHHSYLSRPRLTNSCKVALLATWLALLSLGWACFGMGWIATTKSDKPQSSCHLFMGHHCCSRHIKNDHLCWNHLSCGSVSHDGGSDGFPTWLRWLVLLAVLYRQGLWVWRF